MQLQLLFIGSNLTKFEGWDIKIHRFSDSSLCIEIHLFLSFFSRIGIRTTTTVNLNYKTFKYKHEFEINLHLGHYALYLWKNLGLSLMISLRASMMFGARPSGRLNSKAFSSFVFLRKLNAA